MIATWDRFVDMLAGGKPNTAAQSANAGKPWFERYSGTLLFCAIVSLIPLFMVYLSYLLNPVPQYQDLHSIEAKVIGVYFTDQQFLLRLPNGANRVMEWPGAINLFRGTSSNGPSSNEQMRSLEGCNVRVKGAPLAWPLNHRFRIWEFDCPSMGISFDYETIKRKFFINVKSSLETFFIVMPMFGFIAFILFIREKRGLPISPGIAKYLSRR